MAFTGAPRVEIYERDLSEVASVAGGSTAGIISAGYKGIVGYPYLFTNSKEPLDTLGIPFQGLVKPGEFEAGMYASQIFLSESNTLWYVRKAVGDEKYATFTTDGQSTSASVGTSDDITASATLVEVEPDSIPDLNIAIAADDIRFSSPYPGVSGNDISIIMTPGYDGATVATWAKSIVGDESDDAENLVKIDVFQDGVQVEGPFIGGTKSGYKDSQGKSLDLEDVINGKSVNVYVSVGADFKAGTTIVDPAFGSVVSTFDLAEGLDSATQPTTNTQAEWDLYFGNPETRLCNILLETSKTGSDSVSVVAEQTNNACGIIQQDDVTDTTVSAITAISSGASSYLTKYSGYINVNDSYSGKKISVPLAYYGASKWAYVERTQSIHTAPFGPSYGVLSGVIGSITGMNIKFDDTKIGLIYDENINTARWMNGIGPVIWGQKTSQVKASATDRIGVRRLINNLKFNSGRSLFQFLGQQNTGSTRNRAINVVEPLFRTALLNDGLTNYDLVCDETNNTPAVIDNNEMVFDAYCSPTKTVELIRFTITITRTGISLTQA